jgi:hypothetical protein
MKKQSVGKLALALTLLALAAPGLRASTTTTPAAPPPPPPPPQSVTGTDPVPTSPNIIDVVLTMLHLA